MKPEMGRALTGVALVAAIGIVIGAALYSLWLMWFLWCFVLSMVWASGPENFIRPSYWLFVGMWALVILLGRAVFGRRSGK